MGWWTVDTIMMLPELQGVEHQPAQRHVALPDDGQHARHAVQQYITVQYIITVQYSTAEYSTCPAETPG